MSELERTIEQRMGRELKALGCLYYKWTSPGTRGVPDRIVVCPDGRVVFLELKREDGIVSPQQKIHIRQLREHGQDVRVIWGAPDALEFVTECRMRYGEHI